MSERAFNLGLLLVAICGVIGVFVFNNSPSPEPEQTAKFERLKDWKDEKEEVVVEVEQPQRLQMLNNMRVTPRLSSSYGVSMRERALNLTLVTDYECPWCKKADSAVNAAANNYGVGIVRSIIHFPLQMHKQAMPAARALECALDDGVAYEMNAVLFANQDSLGLKSWGRIAEEARVEDTTAFKRCVESTKFDKRIKAGIAFAKRHNITATPALIVNGTLVHPADANLIARIVDSLSTPPKERRLRDSAKKVTADSL